MLFWHCVLFFLINFKKKKIFQEYDQGVKQFGSRLLFDFRRNSLQTGEGCVKLRKWTKLEQS